MIRPPRSRMLGAKAFIHQPGSGQVDVDLVAPVGRAHVEEVGVHGFRLEGGGIVEHDVDVAEGAKGNARQMFDIGLDGNVGAQSEATPSLFFNGGLGVDERWIAVGSRRVAAGAHHYLGSHGGPGDGGRFADAAAGAGYDRDLADQGLVSITHRHPLRRPLRATA
jgi:hypothetical protein